MNRFTSMRQNVEAALEDAAAVQALGLAVHKWDGARKAIMDDPTTTLAHGLRVDPGAISFEPWAMNGRVRCTQTVNVQAWLAENKGLKAEEIEAIIWAIFVALAPMIRERTMANAVDNIDGVTVKGEGSIVLAETADRRDRDPNEPPKNADMSWATVAAVEIVHEVPVSELA